MKLITLLLITLLFGGCASTKITSFTDPDFLHVKYNSYVVVTPNLNLEYSSLLQNKICDEIQKNDATCTIGIELFPPTREFSNTDKSKIIKNSEIEGYLIVLYSSGGSDSQIISNLSYGTANVYGNSINAYGMSTPVYSYTRRDGYNLILVDTASFQKAWVGSANVHASGLANITDDVFTTSLAQKIADVLKTSDHL